MVACAGLVSIGSFYVLSGMLGFGAVQYASVRIATSAYGFVIGVSVSVGPLDPRPRAPLQASELVCELARALLDGYRGTEPRAAVADPSPRKAAEAGAEFVR